MAKGKVRLFFRNLKRVLLGRRGHTRSKQPPIEDRVVRRERRSQPRRDMDGAADRGSESLRRQRQSRCASKSVGSSLSSFEEDSWPLKSEHGTVKKEKGKKTSRLDGDARLTTIGDPNYSSSCEGERLPPNDTLLKGRICKSHSESSISPSEGSSGQARIEKGKGTAMIDGLQRTEDPRGWEYFKDSGNSSMEMGEARIEPSHDANDTSRTVAQAQGKWESFNDSKGSDRSEEGDNNVPVMQYTIPESSMDIRKVCFIGAGYVGGSTATVLAFYNPFLHVTVVDKNPDLIRKWNSRHLPLKDETGLRYLVRIARDGTARGLLWKDNNERGTVRGEGRGSNLVFSNDVRRGIVGADMVFLCVETPAKKDTEGNGMELDTWPLERAVNEVAKAGKEDVVVVVKSTVPVGMAKKIAEMIMRARPGMSFEVVSNPEFLCEGKAVWNLQFPDRVLIGSAMTNTGQEAALALANIYASWVNPEKIQFLSNPSAELAKLASNAMLAQRISSVNAISVMCEQTGADISQVRQALGSDPRIGSSYLKAGIGFGGPCLRKDTLSLAHTAGSHGLSAISKYWMDIVQVNDYQSDRFVQQVVSRLGDSLFDKKVAIFGWAFKKRTSDSRGSRSICVLKGLLSYSLKEIAIFDPGCNPTAVQKDVTSLMQSFPGKLARLKTAVVASGNPYAAAKGANAILILTDWDVFKYYPPFGGPPSDLPRESSTDNDSVASSFTYSSKASSLPLEHDDDLIHSNPNILGRIGRSGIYIRNLWSLLKPEAPCHPKCQRCMNRKAEFKNSTKSVEWERIAKRMENPKWIFDGRNVVNVAGMERLGFRVETIGNARKGEMDWDDLDSI